MSTNADPTGVMRPQSVAGLTHAEVAFVNHSADRRERSSLNCDSFGPV